MSDELSRYARDPGDAENNFALAGWYEDRGHLSPASGFYMRAAEFSGDERLAYESLLRMHNCYDSLSGRDYTCENILKSALELRPRSPEAYFLLSRHYERRKNWMDSYLFASLGMSLSDRSPSGLRRSVGYEGEYVMLFQQAVSAWWYGRPRESRRLLRKLKDEYGRELNEHYRAMVERNLVNLGSGSDEDSSVRYRASEWDLRFPFEGSEKVTRNFSQVCQDLFVLAALNGKRNGTYLEVGSAHSFQNSNTVLLETVFGWRGVGIEIKPELARMYREERGNVVLCEDALRVDYDRLLAENFEGDVVDYLQLDIEPSSNTFEALLRMPFDKYRFGVITYEHDHYMDISGTYRDKSRRYLRNMGYTLVFNDVAPVEGCSFEDWWVREELVDPSALRRMLSEPKGEVNLAGDIMLKKKVGTC